MLPGTFVDRAYGFVEREKRQTIAHTSRRWHFPVCLYSRAAAYMGPLLRCLGDIGMVLIVTRQKKGVTAFPLVRLWSLAATIIAVAGNCSLTWFMTRIYR